MTRYNVLRTIVPIVEVEDVDDAIEFQLLGTIEAASAAAAIRLTREALDLLEHSGAYHAIPVFNWSTTDVVREMRETYLTGVAPTLDIPTQRSIA